VGGALFFVFNAILRDPALVTFSPTLESFNVGGDLFLRLHEAARETSVAVGGSPLTVDVVEPLVPQTTAVITHFRPGANDPPLGELELGLFGEDRQPIDVTYNIGLLQAGCNISVSGVPAMKLVHITSGTNLTGLGRIDAISNGDLSFTENLGDLRVGLIRSTGGNVALTAAGSIVDADGDAASDVNAFSIFLSALAAAIGSLFDELEIDTSSLPGALLTATAVAGIVIRETKDDLKINHVATSNGPIQLTVNETAASGENLLVGAGKDITAIGGMVTLLVGDNITIEGQVNSNVGILMRGDFDNADAGAGSVIHIPGTFGADGGNLRPIRQRSGEPDQHHARHGDDGVRPQRRRRDLHRQQFQAGGQRRRHTE
jgi:hypothetical protein